MRNFMTITCVTSLTTRPSRRSSTPRVSTRLSRPKCRNQMKNPASEVETSVVLEARPLALKMVYLLLL
jgi:hypothetical protein